MSEASSGTFTFLFTDIQGSTRLLDSLGDDYGRVLAEHQGLLREAFARHEGRELDTQGDAFFVAFPTPRDAVLAAIDAHRALRDHEWPENAEVAVRIGLDTGPATLAHGRYTGHAVHRAARVAAAGHGGQTLLSDASERLLESREGLRLRDLGARLLKDIDGRVRLFQVDAPGLPTDFPRLKTLDVTRRRRRVLAGALVLVAAGVAAAFALVLGASTAVEVASNSVGVIDAANNRLTTQFPVGSLPGPVAAGYGSVWVGNVGDGTLSRLDPFQKSVVKTIDAGGNPHAVAVGPGAVWVLHSRGRLTRVDPDVNRVATTIDAAPGSFADNGALAVGGGAVWLVDSNANVARIDPRTNRVLARATAGRSPAGAAFGAGALWVANYEPGNVYRFDARTFARGRSGVVDVGRGPTGVAFGGGYVWVANKSDGSVSRIDPRDGTATDTVVGEAPVAVAYGAGAVWVTNSGDGSVARLDPRSGKVTKTIHVGNSPAGIAVAEGLVWVAVDPA